MSEREELRLLRKKLMRDISKYGRRLDFYELVEKSVWCDEEQKEKREREKQIAVCWLEKTKQKLYKVDAALQGLKAN